VASTSASAAPTGDRDAGAAEQRPDTVADQRFGHVPDQQAGDGDAQLRARQHERGAGGDGEGAAGTDVTGAGAGAQAGAVHRHVAELLGDEVARERAERHDDEHAEQHGEKIEDHRADRPARTVPVLQDGSMVPVLRGRVVAGRVVAGWPPSCHDVAATWLSCNAGNVRQAPIVPGSAP
jgi:hypothetical protein